MAVYVLFADPHLSDRPPSSCTGTYTADLLALLDDISALALDRGAAAIVCAGDFFHHKAPSRTSHRLVLSAIRWIAAAPCPVLVVPGNHDITSDRLESIGDSQPLGVLYEAGARCLDGWSADFPRLYGVPWLQDYGAYTEESDHAVGRAFAGWRTDTGDRLAGCLAVAHAPLYPPGKELSFEYFPADRWAEAMGGRGSVFYGHVHEPHGTYQADGVTFCNNGALSRGSLHEYNLTRTPGATVWDDDTGQFEFIPLPSARPASEVFRLTEKQQVTDMQGRLDGFLAGVSGTSLQVMSAETVIEHVRGLGLGTAAENLIAELLEQAAAARTAP